MGYHDPILFCMIDAIDGSRWLSYVIPAAAKRIYMAPALDPQI
jgi:hypothetical protein